MNKTITLLTSFKARICILILFSVFSFSKNTYSQCTTCHNGIHYPASSTSKEIKPHDGVNMLGLSYLNQNVCGLNYVSASQLVETRSQAAGFNTNGTGLPTSVTIAGLPTGHDTIIKAFLYWDASYNTTFASPATLTITNPCGNTFTSNPDTIGTSINNCWGDVGTVSYRGDVTGTITGNGLYTINLAGTGNSASEVDGVTLLIIYRDFSVTYSGSIVLFDGLNATNTGASLTSTVSGFNVCAATSTGSAFAILSDMQANINGGLNTENFNGSTQTYSNNFWNFCQMNTSFTTGQTTSTFNTYTNNSGGDCYAFMAAGLYWQDTTCIACKKIKPNDSIAITPVNPRICPGDSVKLKAFALGDTIYTWAPATGLSSTIGDSVMASPSVTTTYTVGAVSTKYCDTIYQTVTVTINPPPVITVTPSAPAVCPGGSVKMTAGGASTYTWSPPLGLSSTTGDTTTSAPLATTTYKVIGTTAGGCIDSTTVTVSVVPTLTVTVTPSSPSICTGDSVTLNANGAANFTWSLSTGLSCTGCPSPNAGPASTTTYTVVGTSLGCTNSTTVTVTVNTTPTVTVTPATPAICKGSSIPLTASGTTNYIWSPSGGLTCTNCGNPSANPAVTTTYTVIGTSAAGCRDTAQVTVKVNPLPTITTIPITAAICKGDSTTLSASGAKTYTWLPVTGLSCTGCPNPNASPASTTTYTVTGLDSNGCSNTASVTVTVNPLPVMSVSPAKDSICPGKFALLTASGASTYKWTPGGFTSATISVSPSVKTTYTVVGTSFFGCIDSTTVTVSIIPTPTVAVTPSTPSICPGDSISLTAKGGISYTWSPVTGLSCTGCPSPIAKPASTTTYTVTASNGACTHDTTVIVTVNPPAIAGLTGNSTLCIGTDTTLTATGGGTYLWSTGATTSSIRVGPSTSQNYSVMVTSVNGCKDSAFTSVTIDVPSMFVCCDTSIIKGTSVILSASGSTVAYVWTPEGTLSCFTCPDPTASPTENITYTVVGTDANGCSLAKTLTIDILCTDFKVPNVFTPNGDLFNQQFVIINEMSVVLDSYTITIYDRWGKVMFTSNSYAPADSWSGKTESGAAAPDGVYYYIINASCGKNTYKKQGFVQLIR